MRVTPDILAVLSAAECDGPALRLTGKLDRSTYQTVNRAIEAAGGKWSKKAQAHLFDGDASEAIEAILLTGEVTAAKQEFGAFFTPRPVADRVITLAALEPGQAVLEPSAGHGALAAPALLAGCIVDCVEILEKHVRVLCSTAYNAVVHNDFLKIDPWPQYDRVVMNPPFAKRADIAHVRHATRFLKPGGRLVAIMSAGIRFRQDRLASEFRDFVAERGGEFENLAPGAFKESGADVNACIVSFGAAS